MKHYQTPDMELISILQNDILTYSYQAGETGDGDVVNFFDVFE